LARRAACRHLAPRAARLVAARFAVVLRRARSTVRQRLQRGELSQQPFPSNAQVRRSCDAHL